MSTNVDQNLRELVEMVAGQKLTKPEWIQIRQCIRCLAKGSRIQTNHKTYSSSGKVFSKIVRQVNKDDGLPQMDPLAAVKKVLEFHKATKSTDIVDSFIRNAFSVTAYRHYKESKRLKEEKANEPRV